ncbi:hypothetical protein KDA00_02825 [Candidatus Saccharibacteria bacterium]|nr:hypothetical protein [Candidatus Saccharibacteria bacterium]
MSNPDQLTPQAPIEHPGPQYEMPGPSRTQRAALRVANIAMGGDRGAGPDEVMDTFVTEVGGYEPGPRGYKHEGAMADTRMVALAQDETTIGKPPYVAERKFKNATAHSDHVGMTDLDTAVAMTKDGRRSKTEKGGVVTRARHAVARRSIKKATMGGMRSADYK